MFERERGEIETEREIRDTDTERIYFMRRDCKHESSKREEHRGEGHQRIWNEGGAKDSGRRRGVWEGMGGIGWKRDEGILDNVNRKEGEEEVTARVSPISPRHGHLNAAALNLSVSQTL